MAKTMNDAARPQIWIVRAVGFLKKIWAVHEAGWVFLATRDPRTGRWRDIPIDLTADVAKVATGIFLSHDREDFDLYFCPNAFSRVSRKAEFSKRTSWAQVDIDDADVSEFSPAPNVLIRTSPGRHQGLWLNADLMTVGKAEALSRELAYRYGADRSGWSTTKMLRIPGTINHKPQYDGPRVRLLVSDFTPQRLSMPKPVKMAKPVSVSLENIQPGGDWKAVYQRYRFKLNRRVTFLIRSGRVERYESDRSKCIYEIVADLLSVGATPEEVITVLIANPYFISKYGNNLRKAETEVLRIAAKLGGRRG